LNNTTQETGIPKLYSKRRTEGFFKVDPEIWSRFKGECAARGVTICQVLETLMLAWIEAQKVESTVVRPVTVNLTMQHVVERPRRTSPWVSSEPAEDLAMYVAKFGACYRLEPKGLMPGRIGWCRWMKRWLMGHECATCVHSGES